MTGPATDSSRIAQILDLSHRASGVDRCLSEGIEDRVVPLIGGDGLDRGRYRLSICRGAEQSSGVRKMTVGVDDQTRRCFLGDAVGRLAKTSGKRSEGDGQVAR
jgi:hypothetical protein